MNQKELEEIKLAIADMGQLQRILLIGIIPQVIILCLVYQFKNESFLIAVVCFVIIALITGYAVYLKPLNNLKKDLNFQVCDSLEVKIVSLKGSGKNIVIRTTPKFQISGDDLDRFKISTSTIKKGSKLSLRFSRYGKHLFNLNINSQK